jgi:hypothetical protein
MGKFDCSSLDGDGLTSKAIGAAGQALITPARRV